VSTVCAHATLIRMTFISIKPRDKESQSAFMLHTAMSRKGLIKSNCDSIYAVYTGKSVEIQQ